MNADSPRTAVSGQPIEHGVVSIMMPAFNASRYIGCAIESAVAQRFEQWELVVVDDGSTDDTYEIAASFDDARITVLRQPNLGEARARNAALAAVRGEYLAFLDADDLFLPDHLWLTTEYLRAHPAADGVFTDGYHITEDGTQLTPLSARRRPPKVGRVFDDIVYGSDFVGPPLCVVLRRNLIERHTLRFDARIVMGPDWDFFVRFSDQGPFGYVDQATCLYRVHARSITTTLGARARARERAKCRMSAIKLPSFHACPVDVRFNVFYDLLVVALREEPERQSEVLTWPEFLTLPGSERSRLLRLMAKEAILLGYEPGIVRGWLREARRAAPGDLKTAAVASLFAASPAACGALLRRRRGHGFDAMDRPPFADLGIGS
jgi:glycosyltransferase involved in cell wall biosynthesis